MLFTGVYVKQAHMVLRGHRSIVNQVRYDHHSGIVISSGVEKVIKVSSTVLVVFVTVSVCLCG